MLRSLITTKFKAYAKETETFSLEAESEGPETLAHRALNLRNYCSLHRKQSYYSVNGRFLLALLTGSDRLLRLRYNLYLVQLLHV